MTQAAIGIFETKTHLSEILKEVEAGKEFTITRNGTPVAELVPVRSERKRARFGCAKSDVFHMSEDFDAPLEDFAEYM